MRTLAILACIVALGCMRPQRRRFTDPFASVGARLAAVVKSGAIKVDARAAVKAAAETPPPPSPPVAQSQAAPPPVAQSQAAPPPPPPQRTPDLAVTRVDASRPTVFVLRGQVHGGKELCEQFPTQDECTSACTAKLRPNMLAQPGPGSITSCACTEQDTGC